MDHFPSSAHSHVRCDICPEQALVWYQKTLNGPAFTTCAHHAYVHDFDFAVKGYSIVADYRDKTGEELRAKLLEPAPTVEEILLFQQLQKSL